MVHASLVVHQSFPGIHYTKNGKEKMLSTFVTVVKQKWVYKYYVFRIINNVENLFVLLFLFVFISICFVFLKLRLCPKYMNMVLAAVINRTP